MTTATLIAGDYERDPDTLGSRLLALVDPRGMWLALLYMAGLVLSVSFSVEGAHWVKEMPGLTGFTLFALVTGASLSRLRVNQLLIHPFAIFLGLLMSAWLVVSVSGGDTAEDRIVDTAVRMINFVNIINANGINTDGLPFAAQIVLLDWFICYYTAWFYFRDGNVWLSVLPAGIGLVVNMTYTPSKSGANLMAFLFFALLLIMEANRTRQRNRWEAKNVPEGELSYAASAGPTVLVAGAILTAAFLAPVVGQSVAVALAWEQATGPWKIVERQFDRLFASVSSGTVAPLHSFGRSMPFKGAVNFGDQNALASRLGLARDVVMYVKAEESGYWRAESYSEYTSGGWLSPNRVIKQVNRDNPPTGAMEEYKERKPFTQTVEFEQPLDVLPARGMPLAGMQATNGEVSPPARYSLDLTEGARNAGLPSEMQRLADELRIRLRQGATIPGQGQLQRLLPSDLRVTQANRRGAEIAGVDVQRTDPFPSDFSSIRPATAVIRGLQYSVLSSVSKASVEQLRATASDLPGWVKDEYLQLPSSVPDRVRSLALEWTQASTNTMDRALAIEARLRDYQYDTNIPAPPRDMDGVDFFLFTLKRGYADYHASAMAVMLRELGIASRVAVGYVAGEYDAEKERYTVREIHAHAWVEAFIPSYGWIDFNPAPNWPTPPRIYDASSQTVPDEDMFVPDDSLGLGDMADVPPDEVVAAAAAPQADYSGLLTTLATLAALVLGFWVLLRWLWAFGLRGLTIPAQTYEKMCRLAVLTRFGPRTRQTPVEYARMLGNEVPEVRREIGEIALRYTRARYGARDLSQGERQELSRAWGSVRRKLVTQVLGRLFGRFRR